MMTGAQAAGSPTASQFQLIGGIRHGVGDCIVAVEPGGAVQGRKGALYVVTEPAGDPAVGGEACGLVQATLAHEYYADPALSITTSLTQALNKANNALLQYNRKVLAAGDPPEGLPRKIRVGLSAAIVRPGQLYLCQLKPGLVLWMHQGTPVAFPRPAQWSPAGAQVNGDGEVVGSFYPAPPLGTAPLVEADFAFRRLDPGDLLVLCSSNLAPLLDEEALVRDLAGQNASGVVEYLHGLAQQAALPEAHALAVEVSATITGRRTTQPFAFPPAAAATAEGAAPTRAAGDTEAPGAGRRLRNLFGRRAPDAPEPAPEAADRETVALPVEQDAQPRVVQFRPAGVDPDMAAGDTPPVAEEEGTPPDAGEAPAGEPAPPAGPNGWSRVLSRARQVRERAAPAMGTAGKATLGAAGEVLGATLPESMRHRDVAPLEVPPDAAAAPDVEEAPAPEYEAATGPDEYETAALEGADEDQNRVIDYDAPGRASPAPAPVPWLRWLLPIAVVLLLAVLVFAVQQVLSGQQTARVDGLLAQAQQEETDSHDGAPATQRDHLLKALEQVQQAQDIDPRSAAAARLATHVQEELDTLNGVTRLSGLSLLFDFSVQRAAPAAAPPITGTATLDQAAPFSDTGALSQTVPLTDSATLAPAPAASAAEDYFSQIVVRGDDAFLLDKGSGRLYRFTISSSGFTNLLGPGDQVDLVGSAGQKAHVGSLLFITWRPTADGGDLAALDDAYTAYIWTPSSGQWQAFALGGAAKLDRPRDMGAYDGNLYLLWAKSGQISKWTAGAYDQAPVDWLSDAASSAIQGRNPVALAIDGAIRVLLGDGQIVSLSAGEVQTTVSLPVWPQVVSPLAIFSTETTNSIYVVEAADKRIIRVDKATGVVQTQLKAPADTTAFDGLRNVYVDEAAGKLYVLSGKKLYSATLPPVPGGGSTPAAGIPAAGTPLPAPPATTTP